MKIRTKLLVLSVGIQILMAFAVVLYILLMAPLDKLQRDNLKLRDAALAAESLQGEASKIAIQPILNQFDVYQASLAAFQNVLSELGGLKDLTQTDENIAKAIQSIVGLGDLVKVPFQKVTKAVSDIIEDMKLLEMTQSEIALLSIINKSYQKEVADDTRNKVQFHVSQLFFQLRHGTEALVETSRVIKEQDQVVSTQIQSIRNRGTIIAAAVMLAVFVLGFIVSLALARGIASALRKLSVHVGVMATGDLSGRLVISRNDEVGKLARDLQTLVENLGVSIRKIQAASVQSEVMRDQLVRVIADSSSSAVEIEANSGSIALQMSKMDSLAGAVVEEIGGVAGQIAGFRSRLDEQDRHISETVASVTHMLASIENIDRIAQRDRQSAEKLVEQSEESKSIVEEAFEKVVEITEFAGSIQEMVSVIASIASQTNILAMNAAIEAAHAGEFGKGFAVVADEIGKLASASASSSEEISRTISAIVAKIHEASKVQDSSTRAFDTINESLHEVSDSISEIYRNVSEMSTGSQQIIRAMENLRETSHIITSQSTLIDTTIAKTSGSVQDLGRISHEVTGNIEEISVGMRSISAHVRSLQAHSDELSQIGVTLEGSVAAFTTSEAEGPVPGVSASPSQFAPAAHPVR